jgi:hypothetical protein
MKPGLLLIIELLLITSSIASLNFSFGSNDETQRRFPMSAEEPNQPLPQQPPRYAQVGTLPSIRSYDLGQP